MQERERIHDRRYEGIVWTPENGGTPPTYLTYSYLYTLCCSGDYVGIVWDGGDGRCCRELWRGEGTSYTGWTVGYLNPPDPNGTGKSSTAYLEWTIMPEEILYSLDDDPRVINTTDASGKSSTVTNVSGGKILRWVNGVSEPFADLGERTVIHSLTAIENAVFIEASVYDEAGREQPQYFYTFGGRVCTVPMQGLPQG